jgi:hypothetical protein
MKKPTFKEYLKDHIKRAEKAGVTCEEFDKVKRVKTQGSFLKILADNISYLYDEKIVELKHLQFFDQKELLKVGIYITGNHSIDKGAVFIGGDVTINDVWGGTIKYVWGGTINDVRGGTINDVRGGTINDVRGGTINDVWGGTIKYVWGGTINDVWGGTIKYVWGGTIKYVWGGTINDVRGGTINDVWGGTIKYVWGGTINDVWGNIDRIGKISNLGVVKCMKENKIYVKKGKFEIVEL